MTIILVMEHGTLALDIVLQGCVRVFWCGLPVDNFIRSVLLERERVKDYREVIAHAYFAEHTGASELQRSDQDE